MKLNLILAICLILCIGTINSAVTEDIITFPTWPASYKDHFTVYSGYLQSKDKSGIPLHYMFLTKYDPASSDPTAYPVITWLQGGNGCSSLQGLAQEIGPYLLRYPRTTFKQTLNQYSWIQQANLLFIEAPVRVGFSYTGKDDQGSYEIGDETTSNAVYEALQDFFSKYSEFNKSKFIIAAEGTASQYGTLVASKIFQNNANKKLGDSGFINLDTLLLNNPLVQESSSEFFWDHYYSHEMLDMRGWYGPQMDELWYRCNTDSLTTPGCEYFKEKNEYTKIQLNPYNINAKCENKVSDDPDDLFDITENAYCKNWESLEKFFNTNKSKFNVLSTFPEAHDWQVCSWFDEEFYVPYPGGVSKLIGKLIKENKLNVILYTGLNDSTVPFNMTEQDFRDIIRHASLTDSDKKYDLKKFLAEGQIQGWVIAYDKLQYVTVRNAGHQVPGDNPSAAYKILQQTLKGKTVAE